MFSVYGHADFSKEEGVNTQNVLDVLQRAGVNVVWLDNNSDSKGVANRIDYQADKTSANNTQCDDECQHMKHSSRREKSIIWKIAPALKSVIPMTTPYFIPIPSANTASICSECRDFLHQKCKPMYLWSGG